MGYFKKFSYTIQRIDRKRFTSDSDSLKADFSSMCNFFSYLNMVVYSPGETLWGEWFLVPYEDGDSGMGLKGGLWKFLPVVFWWVVRSSQKPAESKVEE